MVHSMLLNPTPLPIARPIPAAAAKTKANARDLPLQTAGRRAKRRMAAGDENLW